MQTYTDVYLYIFISVLHKLANWGVYLYLLFIKSIHDEICADKLCVVSGRTCGKTVRRPLLAKQHCWKHPKNCSQSVIFFFFFFFFEGLYFQENFIWNNKVCNIVSLFFTQVLVGVLVVCYHNDMAVSASTQFYGIVLILCFIWNLLFQTLFEIKGL